MLRLVSLISLIALAVAVSTAATVTAASPAGASPSATARTPQAASRITVERTRQFIPADFPAGPNGYENHAAWIGDDRIVCVSKQAVVAYELDPSGPKTLWTHHLAGRPVGHEFADSLVSVSADAKRIAYLGSREEYGPRELFVLSTDDGTPLEETIGEPLFETAFEAPPAKVRTITFPELVAVRPDGTVAFLAEQLRLSDRPLFSDEQPPEGVDSVEWLVEQAKREKEEENKNKRFRGGVIDPAKSKLLSGTFVGTGHNTSGIRLSPSGRRVVAWTHNVVSVQEIATGRELFLKGKRLPPEKTDWAAMDAPFYSDVAIGDGDHVVLALDHSWSTGGVFVHNLMSGEMTSFDARNGHIKMAVDFHTRRIALSGTSRDLALLDFSGDELFEIEDAAPARVKSIEFSPDGSRLLLLDTEGTVSIFAIRDRQQR